jgi:methylamine dehydrogenase accessory protein MauD
MNWSPIFSVSYGVLWVVVVVQVVLTLAVARLVGQLMSRRFPTTGARVIDPGPDIGATVESWEGADLSESPLSFRFPRGRALFLLYVAPHCTACARLMPSARRFFKEISPVADAAWVMTLGATPAALQTFAREKGMEAYPGLSEESLPPSWRVGGAPFGLWVGADGVVKAKGMVDRREHLESLRHAAEIGHPSIQSYVAAVAEEQEKHRLERQMSGAPQ